MAKESIEEREVRLLQSLINRSINATEVKFHKENYEKKKRLREIVRKEKEKKSVRRKWSKFGLVRQETPE